MVSGNSRVRDNNVGFFKENWKALKTNRLFFPFFVSVLIVIGFVLLPLVVSWGRFFYQGKELSFDVFFSKHYRISCINTLTVGVAVTCFACLLGTIQAFCFERVKLTARSFWENVYLLPLLIPPYIHSIAWIRLAAKEHAGSSMLPLETGCLFHNFLYSRGGVIFILTLVFTPLVTALVRAGLKSTGRTAEEAALLAFPPFVVSWRITLPLVLPHILGAALLVLLLVVNIFDVPDMLRVRVIPVEIFVQLSAMYDEQVAFSMALPLFVLGICGVILLMRVLGDRDFSYAMHRASSQPLFFGRGAKAAASFFMLLLCTVSTLLPVIALFYSAPGGKLFKIISDSLEQIGYSVFLASSSAALVVTFALPAAYLLARNHPWKKGLEFLLLAAFTTPAVLYSLGLLHMITYLPGNGLSSLPCIAGLTAHFLYIGVKVIQVGLQQLHQAGEEAACISHRSWFAIVFHILLPRLAPFLSITFFLVFLFCFGELSATLLLVPPGNETVVVKMYNLMHYGAYDSVVILSLFIITDLPLEERAHVAV